MPRSFQPSAGCFAIPGECLRRVRTLPRLEALEDRLTPSTLTVLNNADSGSGSLRAAIAAAHSGDAIVFAHSVHDITLTSGQLAVTQSLTIDGPGANKLTISGNDASRVFDVSNGASVTIDGVTVADGATVGGLGGGGILNEAGSTLTLNRDALNNNTATAASDTVDVFGGGLLNEGGATVASSTFSGNQALGGGGGSFFGGSVGGGIDNFGGATLTVTDSAFVNNQALGTGAGNFGIGGAIENNAGLDLASPSTATITNCIFTGNLAGGGAGVVRQRRRRGQRGAWGDHDPQRLAPRRQPVGRERRRLRHRRGDHELRRRHDEHRGRRAHRQPGRRGRGSDGERRRH